MILYIKKRDGQKALFNREKIKDAIKKAFVANQKTIAESEAEEMTVQVVETIASKYVGASYPSVEHTQDIVEGTLMRNGHLDVAKAYILYRERHSVLRQAKTMDAIRTNNLLVVHSSGEEVSFNPHIILHRLERLAVGLEDVSVDLLLEDVCRNVYNKMPVHEINDLVVNCAKQRIETHYNYSLLASRLVLESLYEDVLSAHFGSDALLGAHAEHFPAYIQKGIELEMLHADLAVKFDLKQIADALVPERDKLFYYLGMQTIYDRYLLRDRTEDRNVYELPQYLWMRVSMGLALLEEDPTARAIEFYNELSQMNVVSSTPTLFNSGTTHSQMSSCYLNTVDDSMEGIFKTFSDCAQLSKWAGGIGTNWTSVRSKNAFIKGTNGKSQGIVPFIKIFNDIALAVNQGGKRKGAMAAYLEIWHSDIEEFLELKKNTGDERRRAHDIHTAVFICDLFMKRVRERGQWTLFSPDVAPELANSYGKDFEKHYAYYESLGLSSSKTIEAIDLWRKLLTMLFETGHPWITYKDPCNVRSPQDHVGIVRNSNLCTEITLNTSKDETAVCNLASINLSKMIKNKDLDLEKIQKTVKIAMRMLDNVVDNNFYPTPEAKNSNLKHRPVGLGVMGYQDALYQLEIDFDSDENVEFADYSMEAIAHSAILGSALLAKERGAYPTFKGSKWDRNLLPLDTVDLLEQERGVPVTVSRVSKLDWTPVREAIKAYGMRNSNCMAIAPTATISNIAGTVPCVEPAFKNIYMKENLSGNFVLVNTYLVDALKEVNLWNDEILTQIKLHNGSVLAIDAIPVEIRRRFKETFEIEPQWIIQAAARRAKWIDQSASTNLFIKTQSGKVLSELYMMAWELGIKTTYYLRTLAASQVTKAIETPVAPTLSKQPAQDHSAQVIAQPIPAVPTQTFKACSITDPDCEACQ